MIFNILVVVAVIIAIFLTITVLVQNSKDGGLAAGMSGTSSVIGARQTTELIEKITWTLAILLVIVCFASAAFIPDGTAENQVDTLKNEIENTAAPVATPTTSIPMEMPAAVAE